jgi:hypothetical protein
MMGIWDLRNGLTPSGQCRPQGLALDFGVCGQLMQTGCLGFIEKIEEKEVKITQIQ